MRTVTPTPTAGADIDAVGVESIWGHGNVYPLGLLTPWVDKAIFTANKNLFVNTMSYHYPRSCSIGAWKRDGWVTHTVWGIPKAQINLGIGYYSYNITASPRKIDPIVGGEPSWNTLSQACPSLSPEVCVCQGINFASKAMNREIAAYVKAQGFRGLFPWAANYDSPVATESLAVWLGKGLGRAGY